MCSLEEAFTTMVAAEDPESRVQQRKRRKRRDVALPPEPAVIDPDRPANRPLPPAELLQSRNTKPEEAFTSSILAASQDDAASSTYFPAPSIDTQDENVYLLEPDWTKAFNNTSIPDWLDARIPNREAESPLTQVQWMDGSATLWQNVPQAATATAAAKPTSSRSIEDMQQKLERMFAKMEELDSARAESNHIEIILFVLGGIFILLIVDLLVKQGTQASFMLAAAGGSRLFLGGGGAFP